MPYISMLAEHNVRKGFFELDRYFFSREETRMHVHVHHANGEAKFWLDPLRLEHAGGCGAREVARIEPLIRDHRDELLRAWHEFFSD